jgi:putative DNA primase/helicase
MDMNIYKITSDLQEEMTLASTRKRITEINTFVDSDNLPIGFELDEVGVWHIQEKPNVPSTRERICSPLWVTTHTRDHKNENHGRILEFQDIDGHKHQWTMPAELLAGEGVKILGTLLNMGLWISHKKQAREKLLEYITLCNPIRRARCVLQCGWYDKVFVLPNDTIGYIQGEKIIHQNPYVIECKSDISGSLIDWKEKIAKKACGNSRLILAISASFAGPLLHLMNHENIGIHYKGHSSLGKSTALHVANSIWGNPTNIHTFRATANGLEGIASIYNDRLLCLDELGQISPGEAGHVIYMLGNGMGKGRANQHGFARKQSSWRLVFLSTGELSLSQLMEEAGNRVKAGQEVRLIEIPADTRAFGLFENLHGFTGGADFSTYLKDTCSNFYGIAAKAFLKRIVEDIEGTVNMVKAVINGLRQRYLPKTASPQVIRVFDHLALIAAAGELASKFGITGWEVAKEEAIKGVMKCFQDWLNIRGDLGMHEESHALAQVRNYFELHGESRFSPWERNAEDKSRTINRVGFRKETNEGSEFYVFTDCFRSEICKGFDYRIVEKICVKHGFLIPDRNGSPTRGERLPGMTKNKRCYRFSPEVLTGSSEDCINKNMEVL